MWQAMPPLFLLGSLCFGRLEGAYFILFWHLVQSAPLPAVFWLALQLVWLWFPTLCLIGRLSCFLHFLSTSCRVCILYRISLVQLDYTKYNYYCQVFS